MLPARSPAHGLFIVLHFANFLLNNDLVVGASFDGLLWVQTAGIGSSISPVPVVTLTACSY